MTEEDYAAAVKQLDYESSVGKSPDIDLQAKVQRHQMARRQMEMFK